ncbi:MAG: response regulator [Leptolyngbya sp. SIO1E4]|nr:response regulator [Leptolyngbya sp. SIO1E4]
MTSLVLTTVTSLSLIWIQRERQQFRAELESEAATILATMQAMSQDDFYYRDFYAIAIMLEQLQRDLSQEQHLVAGRAYQEDGRLVADSFLPDAQVYSLESDPWGQALIESKDVVFQWQAQQLVAGQAVRLGDETLGALSISLSTAPLATKVNTARNHGIGLAVIASLVGITLARVLSRSIIDPLKTLTQATQRIAHGDLGQTIEVKSQDELAVLAQAFNHMAQQLQTSIQRLEEQTKKLQQAKEDAEAASHAKGQFLAHMSHELRTPLNAILGFAQQLQRDNQLSTEQHQSVNIINRSGEYLLKLINDILEISKIESDQTHIREQNVNLGDLLSDLENMFKLKADVKGISLLFQQSPESPQWIRVDEGKLSQVLINLLGNAIKFIQVGHVHVQVQRPKFETITLELAHPEQCWLTIEVSDTGPGIAEEEMDSLFVPFSQTQVGLKSLQGNGLGLAISKRLVKLMGGDIQVRSQLHQGSTFSITIPVLPINPPISTDSPASAQVDIELRSEQRPYRILVVDDVLVNRLLLTKIFDSPSFAVKETQNGKEAIEVWQNWHPDLVLMDIQMPVMDGYTATRWIKQQSQKTVVIAITANAFEEERQAILKAGCDDFISKPFQRDEVLAKVIQHLETNYIENSKSSI